MICGAGRGPRVGDISRSWSAATGRSRCSEVACGTRLCRSWPGIAGSPFLDGWAFRRCSRSALGSVRCLRRVEGGERRLPERRSPKRKNGNGSSSPGPVRRAEPVGCVLERLHLFPREEGCRGRHGEAAIVTPSTAVGGTCWRGRVALCGLGARKWKPWGIVIAQCIAKS